MDVFGTYLENMQNNSVVILIVVMIVFDTVLGCIRAGKNRELNSSFGIDGGIRKACMVASIAFLGLIDQLLHLNFIGFIPEEYLTFLGGINHIGCMEFFGILYFLYEGLSVLKNMVAVGIPMPKWLHKGMQTLLTDMTKEMTTEKEAE